MKNFLFVLIFLFISPFYLQGQTWAALEGQVRDPAGLPVPGAPVVVVEVDTAAELRTITGPRGWYRMADLPVGVYRISVAAKDFKSVSRPEVLLSAGQTTRADFDLEVGGMDETIEVVSRAPMLSAGAADWGGGVERQSLATTPLEGRDLFALAGAQQAGTVTNLNRIGFPGGFGAAISFNGGRPNQNGFRVDGIQLNDATGLPPVSAAGQLLGLESTEELTVVTSPFSAEYGRAAAGVVSAISKSGGNQWHGSAYELFRNDVLDARNYFDAGVGEKPPFRRNQFGGMLGGPLIRDRLFLLVNPELIRETQSFTNTVATPTEDARMGLLPQAGGSVAQVPVSPVAAPYVALFPLPNGRSYGDGTAAFTRVIPTRTEQTYFSAKGDAIFSDRIRTSLRMALDNGSSDTEDTYGFYEFQNRTRYKLFNTDTQWISSPSLIHHFRAGFSRNWNYAVPQTNPRIPESLSFIPEQPFGVLQVTGLRDFGGNRAVVSKLQLATSELQLNYEMLYTRGAVSIKAGGGYTTSQINPTLNVNSGGLYVFGSLASFLAGRPIAANLTVPGSISARSFTQHIGYAFLQVERRVSPSLTLSGGVRYQPYTAPRERHEGSATMAYPVTNPLELGGPLYDNPSAGAVAPRVALAWNPTGSPRTVVRAGFGIFYDILGATTYVGDRAFAPQQKRNVTVFAPTFPNPLSSLATVRTPPTLDLVDYDVQQPYVMQWQASVERQLGEDTSLTAGYSGSRGVHLAGAVGDINPPRSYTADDGSLAFEPGSPLLNPQFGPVAMLRTQFNLFYHALSLGFDRRLADGLRVRARYRFGKTIDETSSVLFQDFVGADKVPNMYDYRANRGRADYDLRHALSLNYSYAFPVRGGRGLSRLWSDWELHGLMQAQSGRPFNPKVGFDRAAIRGADDLGQRPDLTNPGADIILGGPSQYFDPLAFSLPPVGELGNLGRNTLTGPGLFTWDAAVQKAVYRSESQTVTLRLEAFNLTNRANFQIPSVLGLFNASGSRVGSAGQITETTTAARQVQLVARWTF